MAFNQYFNMEILCLEIIEENLSNMKTSIECSEDRTEISQSDLSHNLKHGVIILNELITYLESSLNTIINENIFSISEFKMDITNIDEFIKEEYRKYILRLNLEDKIKMIYKINGLDFPLKQNRNWKVFVESKDIRNSLSHFKGPFVCYSGTIGDFSLNDNSIIDFFIKDNFEIIINSYKDLIEQIANDLGLKINSDCEIIDSEGISDYATYIIKR